MSQALIVLLAMGSFSPPHYMHLRMFEIARDHIHAMGFGTVIGGIISPVHDDYGKKSLVRADHRKAMMKLILNSSKWIKLSEWQTNQSQVTRASISAQYHEDTMNSYINYPAAETDISSWFPDDVLNMNIVTNTSESRRHVQIKFLCGADTLEAIAKNALLDEDLEELLGRYGVVSVARQNSYPERVIYESDQLYKYKKNIIVIPNHANDISSTEIRRLIRRGESAKYLTDDAVLDYISQHGLYGSSFTKETAGFSWHAAR